GKLGILWQVDRRTGEFINATDLGYQTLVDIDKKTGRVSYRPGQVPKLGEPLDFCPTVAGGHTWRAMAVSPQTNAFYLPNQLACNKLTFRGGMGAEALDRDSRVIYLPAWAEGKLGEFLAIDVTGKVLWRKRQRATFNSSALTTAGGLAFVGD